MGLVGNVRRIVKVLRHSAVIVFFVTALSIVACPVQAHQDGYSGYSTGYTPRIQRASQPVATAAEEEATEFSSEKNQVVSTAKTRETARTITWGTDRAITWETNRTTKARQRDVVRTAFEGANPVEVDEMPSKNSREYWHRRCEGQVCAGGACGEENDCCSATSYPLTNCQPRCYWARAEYLGWWKQGMRLPALVTTNPTAAPTLADPDTVILFGNDTINKDAKSGGRFALGMWADSSQLYGFEFTYMNLGTETMSYHASGNDYAILGRPFFNIETAAADANLINYPSPVYTGRVSVVAKTNFQGTELLYRRAVKQFPCSQVDLLIGWRWLQLKDDLLISESVTDALATTINLSDQFNTKNNFHGVEFGVQWRRPVSHAWTLEALGKLALGNNHSVVMINGRQTADPDQGLLALNSNSGTHTRNSLSAVTELGLSVRRRFDCGLEASFGYTFVYWSDVMRAGDQIDLNVDPRQIPPAPQSATHPAFPMSTTDFWAQGLQFGLEYTF